METTVAEVFADDFHKDAFGCCAYRAQEAWDSPDPAPTSRAKST